MTYGNSVTESVSYNARLLPSAYSLGNVNYVPYFQAPVITTLSWSYDYYNDGRLSFSHHPSENKWDRSYAYDKAGRLSHAKTNKLARGQSWDYWNPDPYEQVLTYDAFNHMSRTGRLYKAEPSDLGTYVNNRRTDGAVWSYDASGNVTNDLSYTHLFDASGQDIKAESIVTVGDGSQQYPTEKESEFTNLLDGDGKPSKRTQITRQNIYDSNDNLIQVMPDSQISYFLRSTVLGGQAVVDFQPNGGGLVKQFAYIYASGQRIAKETGDNTVFEHRNPGKDGYIITNGHPSSRMTGREERDALGGDVPLLEWIGGGAYKHIPENFGSQMFIEGGDPSRSIYSVDGLPVSESQIQHMLDTGSVVAPALDRRGVFGFWSFRGQGLAALSQAESGHYWLPGNPLPIPHDDDGEDTGIIYTDESHGTWIDFAKQTTVDQGVGQRPQNPQTLADAYKILDTTVGRVLKRLENPNCRGLLDKIDPEFFLRNLVTISTKDQMGNDFLSEGHVARTIRVPYKGQTLASGTTVYNQNSFFFTEKLNGASIMSRLTERNREANGLGNLSFDQIRELIVIHELIHINDTANTYTDIGQANAGLNNRIRANCF